MEETQLKLEYTLNNGRRIPSVGMGTYRIQDSEIINSLLTKGLEVGYRLIDSAQVYKNEESIGKKLCEVFDQGQYARSDLFVTTKIAPKNQGYEECIASVEKSLQDLKLSYIDLVLIHWPGKQKVPLKSPSNLKYRTSTYQALEHLYTGKKILNIGISNYTSGQLEQLLSVCKIKPQVLQMELHPLYYKPDIVELCKREEILIQAYSSLGEGSLIDWGCDVGLKLYKNIESKYEGVGKVVKDGKDLTPYLLRWALLRNFAIIPKTKSMDKLAINFDLFNQKFDQKLETTLDEITNENLNSPFKFCWDPETVL